MTTMKTTMKTPRLRPGEQRAFEQAVREGFLSVSTPALVAAWRAHAEAHGLPVIVVSGNAGVPSVQLRLKLRPKLTLPTKELKRLAKGTALAAGVEEERLREGSHIHRDEPHVERDRTGLAVWGLPKETAGDGARWLLRELSQ